MSKAAIPLIALTVGGLALFLLTREAKAAPPPTAQIPTADDIMGAQSIAELNAWYNLIGELYITGKISLEEYTTLYGAYETRFYELIGGVE